MNHPRINRWFSRDDQALTPVQERAWESVRAGFKRTGEAKPPAGFMRRWEARFTAHRAREERRQAWIFLGVNAAAATVLFVLFAILSLPALASPVDLFTGWLESLTYYLAAIKVMSNVAASLGRTLPALIPAPLMQTALIGIAGLVAVWILTLRQYALNQGVSR